MNATLEEELGKDKTEELTKLTANFNKYVSKFKKKVNDLVEPLEHEVLVVVKFVSFEDKKKFFERTLEHGDNDQTSAGT